MKPRFKFCLLVGALMVRFLLVGTETAMAQDQSGSSSQGSTTSTISAADKLRVMKARQQVLANNPDLKSEQEALAKQREGIKDASPDDRKAFFQSFIAHQKKMRDAMLQIDPTLGPILDQLAQEQKQKWQQRASQNNTGGN